jgi:uncharacterized protein YfaS (alpha-2-macroglobulin family)
LFGKTPDEKALSASLSVEPEQAYSLKKVSEKEYSVKFENPLTSNSIYSFILNDKNTGKKQSWSFQTKKSFSVVRTLPRDQSAQVPVNSGIEITFSHKDVVNAEQNFSISPEVKGRFEWHDKILVFVPEKLEKGTIYTVTLKKGIGLKGSSETLAEDLSFRFQTEMPDNGKNKLYYSFSDIVYSFTTRETPALSIFADEKLYDTDVQLELYSYNDNETFLNDLKKKTSKPYWAVSDNTDSYDKSSLQKAAAVTAHVYKQDVNYWSNTYLVLPSTLPEGYYLVCAEVDGSKYYTQLQINNTSVYIMTTEQQSIAWLNDSTTGQPLEGAEFMLDGGKPVKADQSGMAVINEPLPDNETNCTFFLVRPGTGPVYVARVLNNVYQPYYDYNFRNGSDTRDNYWTYLYLDKDMFLPEDTINTWGVLKPRDGSAAENEGRLELIRYVYYSEESDASVLSSQNVKISPNGTFTGSLKISGFNPGSYEVRVLVGDKVMMTRYIEVMDYTKPVYKLEIDSDRKYISLGEKINYSILSAFYEGTPVSDMKLSYTGDIYGSNPVEGKLTCDSSGTAKLTLQPTTTEQSWSPLSFGLTVMNSESGEQQIMESNYVYVFPRDTMIKIEPKSGKDKCTFNFETNKIDLSRLEEEGVNMYDEKNYKGASVDIPLSAELYERHYESKKTGSYYDFINKVTRDTYEYYEVQSLVQNYSFKTVNGKYSFDFVPDKDKQYILEVFGNDAQGRTIHETAYAYVWDWYSYDGYGESAYGIGGNENNRTFRQDDTVSVEVKYNSRQPFTGSSRKYLFVRLQNGILDYKVSGEPVYNFGFDKEFIPNMYVKAVCFDGANVYDAGIREYLYDSSEKNLDIIVKADKEYYRPGDTVKLNFEVKDASGAPWVS